ncbi:hypothetical protein ACF1B0_23900 [Streptomyces anandii]|uniref:hypothetical protein n=1 Tax=Streptomyces anandii TaxID=285454 RepID=UPI003701A81F
MTQQRVFGTVFAPEPAIAGFVPNGTPGGALPAEPVLPAVAVLLRLPVAALTRHRLSDPGRCLYLFLSWPRPCSTCPPSASSPPGARPRASP